MIGIEKGELEPIPSGPIPDMSGTMNISTNA